MQQNNAAPSRGGLRSAQAFRQQKVVGFEFAKDAGQPVVQRDAFGNLAELARDARAGAASFYCTACGSL